jgi:hypothetical protein
LILIVNESLFCTFNISAVSINALINVSGLKVILYFFSIHLIIVDKTELSPLRLSVFISLITHPKYAFLASPVNSLISSTLIGQGKSVLVTFSIPNFLSIDFSYDISAS